MMTEPDLVLNSVIPNRAATVRQADIAIRVEGLSKQYRIGKKEPYRALRDTLTDAVSAPFRYAGALLKGRSPATSEAENNFIWALKDVSFEVRRGEVVGVIGRNGAGKTTLLKILSRITEPTEGYADVYGRVRALLEVGTGFHPELTGRENIYLNAAILGMPKSTIDGKFDEIVAFAETEKFIDTPVKHYSSGMRVRLGFAVAAHLEPDILLVDEVLAVGDVAFQQKCLGKVEQVAKEGRTVLFVSHSVPALLSLCSKGILLDAGQIKASGSITEILNLYLSEAVQLHGESIFSGTDSPETELRFRAVRVRGPDRRLSSRIDLRSGLTLEIEYEIVEPVRSAHVGFELWNSAGICVLCSTDVDRNPEGVRVLRDPGVYRASSFVPPEYLRPGRYRVDLGSSVPGVRLLDEVRDAIAFEVLDSGSVEFKLGEGRRGVVAPLLYWATERI